MDRVLVTVPTGDRQIHTGVAQVVARLQLDPRVSVRFPRHRPFEHNLQRCIDAVVDEGFTWWLSIDADNPPERNPLDLVALNRDWIGLPTPVWRCEGYDTVPWYWNVYQRHGDGFRPWPTRLGLQRVDATGTGCFLAHRRVFERPALRYGAFQRTWIRGSVELGNDLAFAIRAADAGVAVWAHFDYPCQHYVTVPMLELIRAVTGAFPAPASPGGG